MTVEFASSFGVFLFFFSTIFPNKLSYRLKKLAHTNIIWMGGRSIVCVYVALKLQKSFFGGHKIWSETVYWICCNFSSLFCFLFFLFCSVCKQADATMATDVLRFHRFVVFNFIVGFFFSCTYFNYIILIEIYLINLLLLLLLLLFFFLAHCSPITEQNNSFNRIFNRWILQRQISNKTK